MRCADVENLVHPYVDGELVADDNAQLERHVTDCERCRGIVSFHAGFKANIRARLRARTAETPDAPEALKAKVMEALDRADARGEGPAPLPWRRLAPAMGVVFAAAAAVTLFVSSGPWGGPAESALIEETISAHEKNLPIEVPGADAEAVASWMRGKVAVPVRPPQLGSVSLVGARVGHLRNRDAGQLFYQVRDRGMTVIVFDASGMELSAPTRRMVGTHEVFLDERRGYTVAFYRDRGVGYAFTSDLSREEVLRLVAASLGQ